MFQRGYPEILKYSHSALIIFLLHIQFPLSTECQTAEPGAIVSTSTATTTVSSSTTSAVLAMDLADTTKHTTSKPTVTSTSSALPSTMSTTAKVTSPASDLVLKSSNSTKSTQRQTPKKTTTTSDIYDHPTQWKKFQLPPNYNKELPPAKFREPVIVEFEIHVQAVNPIKAADMDFRFQALLQFRWTDLRLNFSNDKFYGHEHLLLPSEFIDQIWHPDPFIANAKQTEVGLLTGKSVSVYIYRNHTIVYSINLFVTVACAMQFQFYPYDYQLCPMIIESFSYDELNVKFVWSKYQKFTINPKLRLLQFVVTYPLVAEGCTLRRFKEENNVSQLIAYFRFDRLLGNHLIQTFSPCSLVTALSWLSFWLGMDAISARVSLLITSMLILVTQFSGLKADFPPVAYVKAVDIWMAGCMIFVLAALGEFVIVKVIYVKTEDLERHLAGGTEHHEDADTTSESDNSSNNLSLKSTTTVRTTPLVTPAAISPRHNDGHQSRGMANIQYENWANKGVISIGENRLTSTTTSTVHQHHQSVPPVTFVRSLQLHSRKLGSVKMGWDGTHSRFGSSMLNINVPFCWGCLSVPLIWTNSKTKKTHVLWKEIDTICRWVFPVTFVLFLTIYWMILFIHSRIYSPSDHYNNC